MTRTQPLVRTFTLIVLVLCAKSQSVTGQAVLSGSSEGTIYARRWAAVSYNVDHACPTRSAEPWFSTLLSAGLIVDPPRMQPEGLTFRNGLLYVSGDWGDTQNQIAVFSTNFWGDLTLNRIIKEPISNPPPTTAPNNQWWGPEGMTFNTGATGLGANAGALVTVDNEQQGVGNTFAMVDPTSGALSNFTIVTYPEDIAYAPLSQRFYVMYRTPNEIHAFDANMNALPIGWALPTRTRGITVVSAAFGQFITGDNTLTGDIILTVSMENTTIMPPAPDRLEAYKADGTPINVEQDLTWVTLAFDNSVNGGTHTFQAIAVDETNQVVYIGDDSSRCIYALRPVSAQTATTVGPIFGRNWQARANYVKSVLPSRSGEAWYPALAAQVVNPPSLDPEGMALQNGSLYVSGDWNETQNQVAVFSAAGGGTIAYNHAIQMPISNPPPSFPNNQMWGPEGLTFNTSASGYGAGGATLVTVENNQYLAGGNTRALLNPATAALSGFGVFNSGTGSVNPEDIAYGPISNRFYVVDHSNVVQVWTSADPPVYAGTQFATILRPRGIAVISPSFAQYLLQNPNITSEVLLIVCVSDDFNATPHNRLAAYSLTGSLLGQQDLLWTRDAFPGQPLQQFQAITVDEANKVIYVGDEKANAIFVFTVPSSLAITTTSPLPSGSFNVAYSQTIVATGGTPPYSLTIISGALPPGLTLATNGTLSGSPGACGAFSFTVQVTDAASGISSKPFALTIAFAGLSGDIDGNGLRNGRDVAAFVRAELGAGSAAERCAADMNGDFVIDLIDLSLFVSALLGP